ncbi:MAG: hypothetical protein ABR865_07030 [Terracidiphilus sp.]|jgi:hypothetical protein
MSTNSDPLHNEAVERCNRAWQRAYNKKLADIDPGESDYPARKAGNQAYLRAMPPLSGYQNICDCIACIGYALVIDAIHPSDAGRLMAVAKIAIAAVRHEPTALKPPTQQNPKGAQEPSAEAETNGA